MIKSLNIKKLRDNLYYNNRNEVNKIINLKNNKIKLE